MLSRLITYLFLSAVLVHTFSNVVIVADYLVNSEIITKTFCVNKEKPEMKCNGKCHLAKQLKEDEEKKSTDFVKNIEIVMICQSSSLIVFGEKIDFPLHLKDSFTFNEPLTFEFQGNIFHPPILIV